MALDLTAEVFARAWRGRRQFRARFMQCERTAPRHHIPGSSSVSTQCGPAQGVPTFPRPGEPYVVRDGD